MDDILASVPSTSAGILPSIHTTDESLGLSGKSSQMSPDLLPSTPFTPPPRPPSPPPPSKPTKRVHSSDQDDTRAQKRTRKDAAGPERKTSSTSLNPPQIKINATPTAHNEFRFGGNQKLNDSDDNIFQFTFTPPSTSDTPQAQPLSTQLPSSYQSSHTQPFPTRTRTSLGSPFGSVAENASGEGKPVPTATGNKKGKRKVQFEVPESPTVESAAPNFPTTVTADEIVAPLLGPAGQVEMTYLDASRTGHTTVPPQPHHPGGFGAASASAPDGNRRTQHPFQSSLAGQPAVGGHKRVNDSHGIKRSRTNETDGDAGLIETLNPGPANINGAASAHHQPRLNGQKRTHEYDSEDELEANKRRRNIEGMGASLNPAHMKINGAPSTQLEPGIGGQKRTYEYNSDEDDSDGKKRARTSGAGPERINGASSTQHQPGIGKHHNADLPEDQFRKQKIDPAPLVETISDPTDPSGKKKLNPDDNPFQKAHAHLEHNDYTRPTVVTMPKFGEPAAETFQFTFKPPPISDSPQQLGTQPSPSSPSDRHPSSISLGSPLGSMAASASRENTAKRKDRFAPTVEDVLESPTLASTSAFNADETDNRQAGYSFHNPPSAPPSPIISAHPANQHHQPPSASVSHPHIKDIDSLKTTDTPDPLLGYMAASPSEMQNPLSKNSFNASNQPFSTDTQQYQANGRTPIPPQSSHMSNTNGEINAPVPDNDQLPRTEHPQYSSPSVPPPPSPTTSAYPAAYPDRTASVPLISQSHINNDHSFDTAEAPASSPFGYTMGSQLPMHSPIPQDSFDPSSSQPAQNGTPQKPSGQIGSISNSIFPQWQDHQPHHGNEHDHLLSHLPPSPFNVGLAGLAGLAGLTALSLIKMPTPEKHTHAPASHSPVNPSGPQFPVPTPLNPPKHNIIFSPPHSGSTSQSHPHHTTNSHGNQQPTQPTDAAVNNQYFNLNFRFPIHRLINFSFSKNRMSSITHDITQRPFFRRIADTLIIPASTQPPQPNAQLLQSENERIRKMLLFREQNTHFSRFERTVRGYG